VKDFTNVNLPYQGNDYEPGPALPRWKKVQQCLELGYVIHSLLPAVLYGCWQTWWTGTQRHECRGMM
jgi:hypothetical protein